MQSLTTGGGGGGGGVQSLTTGGGGGGAVPYDGGGGGAVRLRRGGGGCSRLRRGGPKYTSAPPPIRLGGPRPPLPLPVPTPLYFGARSSPPPHPPRVMNNQLPINLSGLLLSIIIQDLIIYIVVIKINK